MPASKSPKAPKVSYCCTECGWSSPKWMGQCRECREWGTLEETQVSGAPGGSAGGALGAAGAVRPSVAARPIGEVSATEARARPTGVGELDRVLGGGIVPGAVVLLAGEPGVGKSTLLLDVAAKAAAVARERGRGPVLYVTGEESASQVRLRAERIDALDPGLLLAAETELGALLGHVEVASPSLLVVDSVQTIASAQVEGSAGGVTQVRAVAGALIAVAKERNIPVLLVGHVTKDGGIAGPRVLEHLVDVVTQFEGDRHARLRLLRAVKNRYGPTDEVGCFDLGERGIVGLADPSGLFLSAARSEVPGTCATVTLEGRRPMPVEIQALVAPTNAGSPRRTTRARPWRWPFSAPGCGWTPPARTSTSPPWAGPAPSSRPRTWRWPSPWSRPRATCPHLLASWPSARWGSPVRCGPLSASSGVWRRPPVSASTGRSCRWRARPSCARSPGCRCCRSRTWVRPWGRPSHAADRATSDGTDSTEVRSERR